MDEPYLLERSLRTMRHKVHSSTDLQLPGILGLTGAPPDGVLATTTRNLYANVRGPFGESSPPGGSTLQSLEGYADKSPNRRPPSNVLKDRAPATLAPRHPACQVILSKRTVGLNTFPLIMAIGVQGRSCCQGIVQRCPLVSALHQTMGEHLPH